MSRARRSALALVLLLLGQTRPGVAILAGMPLVVLLFKVAGLYDRDQLRIVRSTLDEAPALAQLTGLYALTVAILHPSLSGQSSAAARSPRSGSSASSRSWAGASPHAPSAPAARRSSGAS